MRTAASKIMIFLRLAGNGRFKYIYASMRRRFIFYFRKGYFNNQMAKRKGSCASVGHCCQITMAWCQYLDNGKCLIYDRQPFFCRIFPIDEKDKRLSGAAKSCGYYFEEK